MRRRYARFADHAKYKLLPDPLYDKAAHGRSSPAKFKASDFAYDAKCNRCICPAGKKLYSAGSHCTTNGRQHHKFQGAKRDCLPCQLRAQAQALWKLKHGSWLLLEAEELFVPFAEFPWFSAPIGKLLNVERPSPDHLYWPELDVDLAVDSIRHPERFPLVSRPAT
jgi:hypothetical protein